jgi:hypothetical protein
MLNLLHQQNLQVKSISNYKLLELDVATTFACGQHTVAVIEGDFNVEYTATVVSDLQQTKDNDGSCWNFCVQSFFTSPSKIWQQVDFVVCLGDEQFMQYVAVYGRVKSLQKFQRDMFLNVFKQYTKDYGVFIIEPKSGQCYWYRVELDERKLMWIRKLQRAYQRKKLKLLYETHNVAVVLCHLIGSYL